MTLRTYQLDCTDALWNNMQEHSVASVPTGGGKTHIIGELCRRALQYPGTRILVVTHVKELVAQNVEKIAAVLPFGCDIGVYCAGLRQKRIGAVTVASIQSIHKVRAKLPAFDLIIVDEAHRVPNEGEGQYRELIASQPDARVIGLSATPYRLRGGLLTDGDLFKSLVYEGSTEELIKQGWLSRIKARETSAHADLSNVKTVAGEYNLGQMAEAMDTIALTKAAVNDMVVHASDRKSIIIFAASVEHCDHIKAALVAAGQDRIAIITEKTSHYDRDRFVVEFKRGTIRYLINCAVYVEGFDAPNVDCVILLRATQSPGRYVQCAGRGLRLSPGKDFCLLLDYGGNIERFGPIDTITAKRAVSGKGVAPVKTCGECMSIISAGYKTCPECGYVFPEVEAPPTPKHGVVASTKDPVKVQIEEYPVLDVKYTTHLKIGGTPSMRVEYKVDLWRRFSEWVCVEHAGFARQKAELWFAQRGILRAPMKVADAVKVCMEQKIQQPLKIMVKQGKYPEIVRHVW
jgi:DNA repair protein RadD